MNAQTPPRCLRLRAVLARACVALCAAAPLATLADPPTAPAPHTLESKVSLADLDLSTPKGVRAAHKRLERKAEYLCRRLGDSVSTTYRWTHAACVQQTIANAIQQLNAPALASADRARPEP